MKKRVIFLFLISTFLLSGCAKNVNIKNTESQKINNDFKLCSQSVSGLQFEYPKSWGDCKVAEKNIYFRTDFKEYDVDLVASIREIDKTTAEKDFAESNVIKKEKISDENNLIIYDIACGGAIACSGLDINNGNYYEIDWSVSSNQPIQKNTDGAWIPNYNFTKDDIWNILKSAKR